MSYTPLLIFVGIPIFILMICKHPRLQKKLIRGINWFDGKGKSNIRHILAFITLSVSIAFFTRDTILVYLLSGYLYGTVRGSVLSSIIYGISLVIGSLIHSDEVLHEWKQVETIDEVIEQLLEVKDKLNDVEMFELIILSRLSPIIPDTFTTMMWNTTGVRNTLLVSGSIIGTLPSIIIYNYLGSVIPKPEHIVSHKYNINYEYIIILVIVSLLVTYATHETARYLISTHRATEKSNLKIG